MKTAKTKERKRWLAKKLLVRACHLARLDAYKIELQAQYDRVEIYKAQIASKIMAAR